MANFLLVIFQCLGKFLSEMLPSIMGEFRKPRKTILLGESEERKAALDKEIREEIHEGQDEIEDLLRKAGKIK